jgi:cation/acetate symporter
VTEPFSIGAVIAVAVVTGIIGARGLRVARTPADFLVAARNVAPTLNASAISGEYLSAASFLGIAGLALADGLGALWYAVGYAAGYLVLLTVVAADSAHTRSRILPRAVWTLRDCGGRPPPW